MGLLFGNRERFSSSVSRGNGYFATFGWDEIVPSDAGELVTPDAALGLIAFMAAIRNVSEDLAKLPREVQRRTGEGGRSWEPAPEHPVHRLINTLPLAEYTPFTFTQTVQSHAMGWGKGLAYIARDATRRPLDLQIIHPSRQSLLRDQAGKLWHRVTVDPATPQIGDAEDRDGYVFIDPADMLVIHGLGPDGLCGYAPTAVAKDAIGAAIAVQRFSGRFFRNGAVPSLYIKHPKAMTGEALQRLRDQLTERHAGAANAHKPFILEEGAEAHTVSIDPEKAQMILTQKYGVLDIARLFRIPPHKLGDLERATFSNIDAQATEYHTDTILPWVRRWEEELDRKLLGRDAGPMRVNILDRELIRGDLKSTMEYATKGVAGGVLAPNEARAFVGHPPVEGGDTVLRPLNLWPIDREPPASSSSSAANPAGRTPPEPDDEPDDDADERDDDSSGDSTGDATAPSPGQSPDSRAAASLEHARGVLARPLTAALEHAAARHAAAAERAATRHASDPAAFEKWLTTFADGERSKLAESAAPALASLAEVAGDGSPVTAGVALADRWSAAQAASLAHEIRSAYARGVVGDALADRRAAWPRAAATEVLSQIDLLALSPAPTSPTSPAPAGPAPEPADA